MHNDVLSINKLEAPSITVTQPIQPTRLFPNKEKRILAYLTYRNLRDDTKNYITNMKDCHIRSFLHSLESMKFHIHQCQQET